MTEEQKQKLKAKLAENYQTFLVLEEACGDDPFATTWKESIKDIPKDEPSPSRAPSFTTTPQPSSPLPPTIPQA